MKRAPPLLWPLLVAALSLAVTAWLWNHERHSQERSLRANFDFGLRQTATRIEERMTSYEQMLRGVRGLFDASDEVTPKDFDAYVDDQLGGADFAGLRTIAYAPLLGPGQVAAHLAARHAAGAADYRINPPGERAQVAPLTYAAPVTDAGLYGPGDDALADPVRRVAMLQARDSGGVAITRRMPVDGASGGDRSPAFVLFMALYAKGQPHDTVAARRAHVVGWVFSSFRVGDLMSSLYGEGTPGLEVHVHDGADTSEASRMYPLGPVSGTRRAARFEAQEYVGFAGHTWTLSVRSSPEFEARFSNDAAGVIAVAGVGCSTVLALLSWLLVTGRERANAAARDMTQQLRASAERYRRIVETANEGIWMVDAEARTTFVNPKMLQMLDCAESDLIGRLWLDFMDHAGRQAMSGVGLTHLKRGMAEHHEIRFTKRSGADLWALVSTSAIVDEAGRYAGALAMVTDVSERRQSDANRAQLEVQLRQSQKMEAIGTLAGGIAHDFNNLLAAIMGNTALCRQELGAGHAAAARLDQIQQAASRGRSLVQQIVAFSRRQPQERVVQPLRPLLEEAATLLRSTLPALVKLELQLSDAPLLVNADATQLQQVLMNLCTNAWHAMADGSGHIVIGLDASTLSADEAARLGEIAAGAHAHVWVSDDGCGMDGATLERIFEPFYTTKPVGKGTGLGLSVVHGIVNSHGGAITVHSHPQSGTRFDMYFPLAREAAALPSSAVAAPAPAQGHGEHVLYVDDDPVMVVMVEGLMRQLGYRVSCASNARQALARLVDAENAVDLVVTDFNMPEVSGIDLARALKTLRPGLPVIITSGYVTEVLRGDALEAGIVHVLQKEYTLEQLGALIHRALAERAPTDTARA